MKRVIIHWVEMRTLEVPDECPTDDPGSFERYLYDSAKNDPYATNVGDTFAVDQSTRDFEIVDVNQIFEAKCGYGEDEYER